jgi:hypothetical protein
VSTARATFLLPALEPLEIHSGVILGARRGAPRPPVDPVVRTPRDALVEAVLPALRRGPCLVAFSGGRDSSAALAVTTHAAREHGLPDPIPVTLRYEAHPRTFETDWQELVIDHLRLAEWKTVPIVDEFDLLGPLGTSALRRHGLYWPPNAHAMLSLLSAADGGSLITGNGGDELFSAWAWHRWALVRSRRLKLRRAELAYLGQSLTPPPVRALLARARPPFRLPWLKPDAEREVRRGFSEKRGRRSRTWGHSLEGLLSSRYLELAGGAFQAFAADASVLLAEPFFDARVVGAIVAAAPRQGYPGRTTALRAFFGDLLPPETITRSTKAAFTEVLWGEASRAFAARWDGSGLDERLVDVELLRQEWLRPKPDFRAMTSLQAAWLASQD